MKKVLLIGAGGMLGQAFIEFFERIGGCEVTEMEKSDLDITNKSAIEKVLKAEDYDFVVNCSAYTNVDAAEDEKEKSEEVNATGVKYLAEVAKANGAIVIHFSTDYVFDGKNMVGYREDDAPAPLNQYGKSKLAGEKYLAEVNPKHYIIRTSWLYGPGGKNFVDTMFKLGQSKDELSVVGDQYGSPTYTYDLAEAVIKNFIVGKEDLDFGIYHLTNTGSASWYEFAKAIFDEAGIDVSIKRITSEEFVQKAKRPSYSMLLSTKLNALQPWRKALKSYLLIRD